ncbi:MAG: helix-turn-helix domain-containing protein [Rhizobiaceae bacterium]
MDVIEGSIFGDRSPISTQNIFDVDQLNEIAIDAGFDCNYTQLDKGRLSALSKFVSVNEVWVIREQVDRSLEYWGTHDPEYCCFLLPLSAPRTKIAGVPHSANLLWMIPAGYELSIVTGAAIDIITLLVPKRLIEEEYLESASVSESVLNSVPSALSVSPHAMNDLSSCLNACFLGQMDLGISLHLQEHLLRRLGKIVRTNWGLKSIKRTRSYSRMESIKKARAYIKANIHRQISTMELCEVTGFSERTLTRHFKDCLGMSPRRYSVITRLDAARQSLNSPIAESGIVTNVALDHGFNHLGRFSSEFKSQFGILPSLVNNRV